MLALIDYGLILVFFLGVLLFVLVLARPSSAEATEAQENVTVTPTTLTVRDTRISYAVTAVLFLLLMLLVLFSAKKQPLAKMRGDS